MQALRLLLRPATMSALASATRSAFVGRTAGLRARAQARSAARSSVVRVQARDAPWSPGSEAPAHLDGSLPG